VPQLPTSGPPRNLTAVAAHGAALPSLWDSLEAQGVPREHRTAACAAFAAWLDAQTQATRTHTAALHTMLDASISGNAVVAKLVDEPIDLWPASW
jgi:hypothetical protein